MLFERLRGESVRLLRTLISYIVVSNNFIVAFLVEKGNIFLLDLFFYFS